MGRQRSMVGRGRRRAVLRVSCRLCLGVQRLLPATYDGSVATHSTRHRDRISQSYRQSCVDPFLGCDIRRSQLAARVVLWCSSGNVIRGVPLDANGWFFLPLWTDFRVGPVAGILDWFTIILGLTSVVALAMQGSMWAAMRTRGDLQVR